MDESALWEKIPQGKLTVPLWYTTRVFPLWETQRAENSVALEACYLMVMQLVFRRDKYNHADLGQGWTC